MCGEWSVKAFDAGKQKICYFNSPKTQFFALSINFYKHGATTNPCRYPNPQSHVKPANSNIQPIPTNSPQMQRIKPKPCKKKQPKPITHDHNPSPITLVAVREREREIMNKIISSIVASCIFFSKNRVPYGSKFCINF